MIKKDKRLYSVSIDLYSSGKVEGKINGKLQGTAQNFLLLMSGDFGNDLCAFLFEEEHFLAELIANFLSTQPEILQAVSELMSSENDEAEVIWN